MPDAQSPMTNDQARLRPGAPLVTDCSWAISRSPRASGWQIRIESAIDSLKDFSKAGRRGAAGENAMELDDDLMADRTRSHGWQIGNGVGISGVLEYSQQMTILNRRQFLAFAAFSPAMMAVSCRHSYLPRSSKTSARARFFFTSQGKTALMNADG